MYTISDDIQIMNESREALKRINTVNKVKDKTLFDEHLFNMQKFDNGKYFFEEFDEIVWESKVKVDMLFYEQFSQKLDDDKISVLQELLGTFYKTIHDIYEFINIKPEIYSTNYDILSESEECVKQKLSKIVYRYLDKNYYNLTLEQRLSKYKEQVLSESKELILKNMDVENAVSISSKKIIMRRFFESISFPFAVRSRLNYLSCNKDYGVVFDVNELKKLKTSFESQLDIISKIMAVCI